MNREDTIDNHIQEVAERNEIKPEEVYVFDVENAPKIDHDWKQYGMRFVCSAPSHLRHEAYGRPM